MRESRNCAGRRRKGIHNIHISVEAGIPFGVNAKVRIRVKSVEEGQRFSVQLRQFVERKDQHCPYCGVSAIRCVKADLLAPVTIEPCGCVLWEGPLPETWR